MQSADDSSAATSRANALTRARAVAYCAGSAARLASSHASRPRPGSTAAALRARDERAVRPQDLCARLYRRAIAGGDDRDVPVQAGLPIAADARRSELLRIAGEHPGGRDAAGRQRDAEAAEQQAPPKSTLTSGHMRGRCGLDCVAEPVDERDLAHGVASIIRFSRASPR